MLGSIKKAYHYMQHNGIEDTFYASMERLSNKEAYSYQPVTEEAKKNQRKYKFKIDILYSILVPTYETKEVFLREMIESVLNQTYGKLELIIADASKSDAVSRVVSEYKDARIKYTHLNENSGISANTNEALRMATGDYIGLLDHDDVLTPDALYECTYKIAAGVENGLDYVFVYSNEDKCNTAGNEFFEPHYKPEFDIDLLMSNNYICHFLVMRSDVMHKLMFRPDYDGAQDHDLVLRAYAVTHEMSSDKVQAYGHVAKVLYHWRCHENSTASNPMSKQYAYDAGLRAVTDFLKTQNIAAKVTHTKHNGFYRVEYEDNYVYPAGSKQEKIMNEYTATCRGALAYRTFLNRYDIGAIGGPIVQKNKITGGIIDSTKTCTYEGMNVHYSGYMHRAVLQQKAMAVDVRNMLLAEQMLGCLKEITCAEKYGYLFNQELITELFALNEAGKLNVPYIDVSELLSDVKYENNDYLKASVELCMAVNMEGYVIYYEPECLITEE
ncbi:MAG: glycosyltransferase [Lachnospiraceae bacterium]|nr:glycosyltransferase [Candidatus Colinaster equi]